MKIKHLAALLVAVILFVGLLGAATAQSPVSQFDTILAKELVTTGDTTTAGDATVAGTLTAGVLNATGNTAMSTFTASGNSNVDGTLAVDGALALSSGYNLVPQTPITVTNTATFTAGGGVQLIQASGSVTPVLNPGSQGQVVTLLNISNQTITIADTTGQLLSAAGTLGQWDTLTLYYYGTSWIEIARSNN